METRHGLRSIDLNGQKRILYPVNGTRSEIAAVIRSQLDERRRNAERSVAPRPKRPAEFYQSAAEPCGEWAVPIAATTAAIILFGMVVFRVAFRQSPTQEKP